MLCASLAHAQDDIELAPGDILSFWAIGALDAPRDVLIQQDGAVYLPLVGTLQVSGLTISQARETLTQRLRDTPIRLVKPDGREQRIGLRPNEVGLDVARFRPVYASGDIQSVGEIPFSPGLTARQAIVKAGGLRRITDANPQLMMNLSNQQVRLQQQVDASFVLLQGLLEEFQILNPDANVAEVPLMARIQALMDDTARDTDGLAQLRQRLLTLEESNRQKAIEQLVNRANVIGSLEDASRQSVEIAEAAVERMSRLSDQGLLRVDAMDSARQNLTQAQTRLLESAAERLRVNIEISRLEGQNEVEILEATERVFEEARAEWNRWESSRAQLVNMQFLTGDATFAADERTRRSVTIQLFRRSGGKTSERAIALDEALAPGDVIEVRTE